MNPATHFLAGWTAANVDSLERRDRTLVTLAGIAPDADAFGFLPELLTRGSDNPILWWSEYHHRLGHNLPFGLVLTVLTLAFARKRFLTAALAFAAFHLHLLCDVLGARGPDGHGWPIPYIRPFVNDWYVEWSGQWAINAWPNFVVTGILLALTFYLAWRRGFSPVGIVSTRADEAFVATLRRRFPRRVASRKEPGATRPRRVASTKEPGATRPRRKDSSAEGARDAESVED